MTTLTFLCTPEATATSRALGYLGLAGFVGGSTFLSFVWQDGGSSRAAKRLLALSVVVGLLGAAGDIGCAVQRLAGAMPARVVLEQPFGRSYFALGLLWVLALVAVGALARQGSEVAGRLGWRLLVTVVGGGLIVVNGETAHGSAASGLGAVTDVVHVAAMSVWVGGLLMLVFAVLPRRSLTELDVVLPRFSRVAQVSVGLVVVSGLAMLWEITASLPRFWGTHYSNVVLIKLGILAATMGAALLSQRWVGRRVANARAKPGIATVAASLACESLGAIAVLTAAGVLATSSPGL